jgi:pimeloyl-ACP methyl ester carboxylesterase
MLGNPARHRFLEELARAHHVIAPSLPGFMPSSRRDDIRFLYDWVVATSEVLDACGLAHAPVVASSLGAMLALEVACVRPDAFERLALISPLGLWDAEHPVTDLFATPSFDQRALLLKSPDVAASFFVDDPSMPRDVGLQHGVDRYHTRSAAASLMWPLPEHGLIGRIHRVTCPVGLVWGDEDQLNPAHNAELYARALSGHQGTVTVANAGHCAEWDAPVETAVAVAKFLA